MIPGPDQTIVSNDEKPAAAKPKISVVVPCYNQAQYLQNLLESVDRATHRIHEVIIVNDGSTKSSTARFLRDLHPISERQILKIVNQINGGLASARNAGFSESRGEFIQFLDADDFLLPKSIDDRLNVLLSDNSDVVVSDYLFCNAEANHFYPPEKPTIAQENLNFFGVARYWERGLTIPIHCGLFRRSILPEKPFRLELKAKEDWVFWMGLFLLTRQVSFHETPGCVYRMHSSNMTRDGRAMALSWIDAIFLAKRIYPHFDDYFVDEAIKHFKGFYLPYFWHANGSGFVASAFDLLISGTKYE